MSNTRNLSGNSTDATKGVVGEQHVSEKPHENCSTTSSAVNTPTSPIARWVKPATSENCMTPKITKIGEDVKSPTTSGNHCESPTDKG